MQARYYDPAIGRFLSIDPVEFSASRPDMFNRYAYAANDPVNMIDPDGRQGVADAVQRARDRAMLTDGLNGNGLPSNGPVDPVDGPIDLVTDMVGTVADFAQNYNNMLEANTIGADGYFHCRANCEGAARGPIGELVATALSTTREAFDQATGDPASASTADQAANRQGRSAPTEPGFAGCEAACSDRRPPALDSKYGHPPPPPNEDGIR
jgi:uncharacterized protein RhaS with RHS repeats